MTRYLVVTQWRCRDNDRQLTFYRSHVRHAENVYDARTQERDHNFSRTEMAEEGWQSRVVHTVNLDTLQNEIETTAEVPK